MPGGKVSVIVFLQISSDTIGTCEGFEIFSVGKTKVPSIANLIVKGKTDDQASMDDEISPQLRAILQKGV